MDKLRIYRLAMVELTVLVLLLAAYLLAETLQSPWGQASIGADPTEGYFPGAQRFLESGSPYLPSQVNGPWELGAHSFIHPPSALVLFVPFLVLPYALWWILPIGLTVAALVRLRPAAWAWPLMALCLCWPRSAGSLVAGNSDIWAMAAVAAGAAWGWPIVILAIKPTFVPLALVAVRRRAAWIAGAVLFLAMVPLTPLWFDWVAVIGNASLPLSYSFLNLPLVLIGFIGWVARPRRVAPLGRPFGIGEMPDP